MHFKYRNDVERVDNNMVKRNEINSQEKDKMAAKRQQIKEGNDYEGGQRHKSRSKYGK